MFGSYNGSLFCFHAEAILCENLSPPNNGEISVAFAPNSLSHGLGSVATYSCDSGYVLGGYAVRRCEDPNGGTVTMGVWSGTPPTCQGDMTYTVTKQLSSSVLFVCKSLSTWIKV